MSQSPAKGETDQENKIFCSAEPTGAARNELAAPEARDHAPASARTNVLVPVPNSNGMSVRRRWRRIVVALAVIVGGAGALFYWWQHSQSQLPPGIAWGNGRIEADSIDIDTKFSGRIAEMLADEGDMVKAGQVVALMDTQDLAASLKKAEALVLQAQQTLDAAKATAEQQKSQALLAKQELGRAQFLVPKGYMPKETLDQRQQQLDGAIAAQNAAIANVGAAEQALAASKHDVELDNVNIADNALVAPREARVQYRIANVG